MANAANVCPEWSGRLQKKEYRDWLSVGNSLAIMCNGLRPYIARAINNFYKNLCITLSLKPPCHCSYVRARRRCPWHDLSYCAWANELINHHRGKPKWQQSDSTKWTDPNAGPWEIAKLFMSDLGNHSASVVDVNTTDPTGLLNLIYWCDAFRVSQLLVKEVRETRNTKWGHAPQQELSEGEKKDAFQAICHLLQDPELVNDPDAHLALTRIKSLETTEIISFEEIEFKVIKDSLNSCNDKIDEILNRFDGFEQASSIASNEMSNTMKQILDYIEKNRASANINETCKLQKILSILEESVSYVNDGGRPRRSMTLNWIWKRWTLILWLLCCLTILHKEEFDNSGCAVDRIDSQAELGLREFRFGYFLKFATNEFVGRQWLFRDIEDVLESKTGSLGVLITGDPGSGKSALVSQLICSPNSSALIHSRILGFHFCSHFNKGTQNAAKFVRNLANMIALKIRPYRYIISSDPFIQKLLHVDCFQDPIGCFEQSILMPLNDLDLVSHNWYVIVDALDECATRDNLEENNIINLLQSKLLLFPKWFRLILTSRRETSVIKYFRGAHSFEIQADNPRNLEDITSFIYRKLSAPDYRLRINKRSSLENVTLALVEKSQGNFLYIKMLLLSIDNAENSLDTLLHPPSLTSFYQTIFERQFQQGKNFEFMRKIFEVLIASFRQLSTRELFAVISLETKDMHFKYDFLARLKEASVFVKESEDEGIVTFYHSSLAEWLTSKENEGGLYYVDKQRGHYLLAKYYLVQSRKSLLYLDAELSFYLASHIFEGGLNSEQLNLFRTLPSEIINKSDSTTKETSLHFSATSGVPEVTVLLEQHFFEVDIEDKEGRTPAFRAAAHGNLKNLEILFKRGANLNLSSAPLDRYTLRHSDEPTKDCKRTMSEYSLLHAAAQGGHTDVVTYLLEQNVTYDKKTRFNYNALHLAAEKGHTKTVETLLKYGFTADFFTLHVAATNGHVNVVKKITSIGVSDSCRKKYKVAYSSDQMNSSDFQSEENQMAVYESALSSAIRHKHNDVVKLLLSKTINRKNCSNSDGFYPLHVAAFSNNLEATKMLLSSGVDPAIKCGVNKRLQSKFVLKHSQLCSCGYSALHMAAELQHYAIAVELINSGINTSARDCNGSTALHIASCRGDVSIVQLLVNTDTSLANSRTYNGSTPLHSAATCYASGVFETLLWLGSDPTLTDNEGMSVFFYVLKDVNFCPELYFLDPYVQKPWQSLKWDLPQGIMRNEVLESFPWYKTLIFLVLKLEWRGFEILQHKNKAGLDIFDFAGLKGLDKASLLLTEQSENTNSNNIEVISVTPLQIAFDVSLSLSFDYHLRKHFFTEVPILPPAISKLFSLFMMKLLNRNCSVLKAPFEFRTPYSAAMLLEYEFYFNCPKVEVKERPLMIYLHIGGRHLSKVLVHFKADINVECGKRFELSPLHLTAYHKLHYLNYLSVFYPGKEWEEYILSKNAIFDHFYYEYEEKKEKDETTIVEIGDGPAVNAIKKQLRWIKIINECVDEDGYNLLHRAAQGANVAAIKKLLSLGADSIKLTATGENALQLSVDYAVKYKPLNLVNTKTHNVLISLEVEFASLAASTLLDHMALRYKKNIGCNENRVDITLYHLAASRGMWRFIQTMLYSGNVVGINPNCTNKGGLTPLYLAKFHGGTSCNWDNPWCKVVSVIESHGGVMRYPTMETEYNLIFYYLLNTFPKPFGLDLSKDELWSLRTDCGVEECKNYRKGETEYLKSSDKLHSILHDNEMKRKMEKYLPEKEKEKVFAPNCSKPVLRSFSSTFEFHHVRFFQLRSQILKDFESYRLELENVFMEMLNESLVCAPRGRLDSCSQEKIDMCDKKSNREIDIQKALQIIYEKLRNGFDILNAHSKEAKKFILSNDHGKEELSVVYHHLNRHEAELLCDWQSITKKYVHIKFLLHSLENYKLALHSTPTKPRIPEFVANRIKKLFIEKPSEKLFNYILDTVLVKPTDFSYLRSLRNKRPPL